MEWFEKEYKKRFKKESSLEGIESGPLWDQISKAIPQEKSHKKPYLKWTFLMLAMVGVVLSLLLFQNRDIENENDLSQSEMSSQSGSSDIENSGFNKESLTANDIKTNNENEAQNPKTNLENNQAINPDQLESEIKNSKTKSSNIKSSAINRKEIKLDLPSDQKTLNKSKLNDSSSENTFPHLDSKILSNNINTFKDSQIINVNDNQSDSYSLQMEDEIKQANISSLSKQTNLKETKSRAILNINSLTLLKNNLQSEYKKVKLPSVAVPEIIVNKKNPWAINVNASANFFSLKYKDDENSEQQFASQVNDSLGPLQIGNSIGINLEYQLNQNWYIGSGIELNNYENKLSAILVTDTTALDDMQKIRKAKNIRTVIHHNKLSTFSIPINITYDYQISRKWSMGASIGMSYSIIKSQKGRLLSRGKNIIDYSDDDNIQFTNFVSFRANPYIRYRINDQISMNIKAGLSYQNHGKSEALDLTQSSMIYNIGIGLRYKL